MNRKTTRALLALGAICASTQTASAQAWNQTEGSAYVKVAYGAATAGEQYRFDGVRKLYADDVRQAAFFDRSIYLYGELGLTDWLTAVVGVPYKTLLVRDTTFRYASGGLGDVDAGLRFRLAPVLGLNTGALALNVTASLPAGYVRNQVPALGMGQANGSVSLDYGFGRGPLYVQAGAGYRLRSGWYGLSQAGPCQGGQDRTCVGDETPDPGDELLGKLEIGYSPWSFLLLQALGSATVSVDAPAVGFTAEQTVPTRRRIFKAGLGARVSRWGYGLSGQIYATPWGQNTVRSVDVFLGLDASFSAWGG